MNDLMVFSFNSYDVRTVLVDGQPWFVARDVCDVLGITNHRDALGRLDEDEKGVVLTDTLGGTQQVRAVNEFGLYALVIGSRKPEAKTFQRWITHDVIPSIRQTGAYTTTQAEVIPLSKDQALVTVLRTTADLVEGQEEIRQRVEQIERKVDEQITLDSGEQRALQKAVARKVYGITPVESERRRLFKELYREIKDRWAVPSYKDVRRTELQEVLRYVEAWRPRAA